MITCCRNCQYQGCGVYHNKCAEYQRQKAEDAAAKEKNRKENLISSYVIENALKIRKRLKNERR